MPRIVMPLVLLLAIGTVRADFELLKTLPAATNIIGRLDVAALKESPLGSELLTVFDEPIATAQLFLSQVTGLDPLMLEELWIFVAKPDTGVVVGRGEFSASLIETRFGKLPKVEIRQRPGCLLALRFPDEKKKDRMQLGVLLDERTLAVGDEESVEALLAARAGEQPVLPADHPRLQALIADDSTAAAVMLDPQRWTDFDTNARRYVRGLRLRLAIEEDAAASLEVETLDGEHALALADLGRGLARLRANDAQWRQPVLKNLLRQVIFTTEDATVSAALTVPGADIRKLLEVIAPRR